jgi:hypothetical protein
LKLFALSSVVVGIFMNASNWGSGYSIRENWLGLSFIFCGLLMYLGSEYIGKKNKSRED